MNRRMAVVVVLSAGLLLGLYLRERASSPAPSPQRSAAPARTSAAAAAAPAPVRARASLREGERVERRRSPEAPAGLPALGRDEVLKRRDGAIGFNSAAYGATFHRHGVEVATSFGLAGVGRPRVSWTFEEAIVGHAVVARAAALEPRLEADLRTLVYARGPVEEQYVLRPEGVEQLFVLSTLPARGAITVTGRVTTNLEAPSGSGRRLSFTHRGVEVMSIAKALAIDGAGRREPLELAYADGRVSMTIPAGWVADATLPITIDPLIGGPERVADRLRDVVTTVQGLEVRVVDAAYNAARNEYFVVWAEPFGAGAFNFDVLGQRIGAAGRRIGDPVQIGTSSLGDYEPTVCWASGADRYLVAWRQDPADNGSDSDQRIQGRVLAGDGSVVGDPFTIGDAAGQDFGPSAAFDGLRWYVAWTQVAGPADSNARGRFVSTTGVPAVQADPDLEGDVATRPAAAFVGGTYVVAWEKQAAGGVSRVVARTLDPSGAFLSEATAVSQGPGAAGHADVSTGAGRALIVWQERAADGSWDVRGRIAGPSLAFAGGAFPVGEGLSDQAAPRADHAAASDQWLVVYTDPVRGREDVYANRITGAGQVRPAERISRDGRADTRPELAVDGVDDEALVVYLHASGNRHQVRAQRVALEPGAPPAPGAPTAAPNPNNTGSHVVSWAASAGTGLTYELQRAADGGGVFADVSTTAATSVAESGLPEGVYLYRVRARTADGLTSAFSEASAEVVVDRTPPPPPAGLAQFRGDGLTPIAPGGSTPEHGVVLRAVLSDALSRARLEVEVKPAGVPFDGSGLAAGGLVDAGQAASALVSPLPPGDYHWRARARDEAGNAGPFEAFGASPAFRLGSGSPPAAPTGLTAVPGNGQVVLNWSASAGALSYTVQRRTLPGGAFAAVATGVAPTSYTDATVVNGTPYAYVVTALNEAGESAPSEEAPATPAAPPAAPANLTATPGNNHVALAWGASAGAASYRVKRGAGAAGPFALLADGIAQTSYTDHSAKNGTAYAYVVSAVNVGGESPDSAPASATPIAPPTAPTLSAEAGDGQATLSWTAVEGASSYAVYRSLTPGGPYVIREAGILETSFIDAGLANGTTYAYVVVAVNDGGASPYSNEALATPDGVPLAAPVITTASRVTADATPAVQGTSVPSAAVTVSFLQGGTAVEVLEATASAAGGWSVTASAKADGTYAVVARASSGGSVSPDSAPIVLTIDTAPPVITGLTPEPDAITLNRRPRISALWSDHIATASARIRLDGVDVTAACLVTADGFTYTPDAPLAAGSHTVVAAVSDEAGQATQVAWTFDILIDAGVPVVSGLDPADGTYVRTSMPTLRASLSDTGGSGLDAGSVVLTLDGDPVDADVSLSTPSEGTASYAADLAQGTHTFAVGVRDLAGNVATVASATFVVDSIRPVVQIASPSSETPPTSTQVPFSATVRDDGGSGVEPALVQVFLNDVDVSSGLDRASLGDGAVSVTGTLFAQAGANEVRVAAVDAAGNPAEASAGFTVGGGGGPQLSTITPSSTYPGARVRLTGVGFTSAGATRVTFSPDLVATSFQSLTDTEIVVRVPLAAQTGPVYVTTDAGSSGTLNVLIQPVPYPPGIPITSCLTDERGNPVVCFTDLVVCLEEAEGIDLADELAFRTGGALIGMIPSSDLYVIRYGTSNLDQLNEKRAAVRSTPGVRHAAPAVGLPPSAQDAVDRRYKKDLTEGRTGVWAWDRIQAPGAWRLLKGRTLSEVPVAIWDLGFDLTHLDFQGIRIKTVNDAHQLVDYTGTDKDGHGTLVGGILTAAADDLGIDGVMSPPMKAAGVAQTLVVFEGRGISEGSPVRVDFAHHLIASMDKAAAVGVRVMNVSSALHVKTLRATIERGNPLVNNATEIIKEHLAMFRVAMKKDRNLLVVFAAGNDNQNVSGTDEDNHLSLFASAHVGGELGAVVIVGGIDMVGNRWYVESLSEDEGPSGSNAAPDGSAIDIAAPAELVLGPVPEGSRLGDFERRVMMDLPGNPDALYGIYNGTSLAAPMVSGTAALCFALKPKLKPEEVRALLKANALPCRVDLVTGTKMNWRLLRMADTLLALEPGLGADKSWSKVYATVFDQATSQGSVRRLQKVTRTGGANDSYQGNDLQTFLQNRFLSFSVAANGKSLVTPLNERNGPEERQHIERHSLVDGSVTRVVDMPYSFIEQPLGGGATEKIYTGLAIHPYLFPSDRLVYLSKQDYQPYNPANFEERDRCWFEPQLFGHGRLMDINRDPWTAVTPDNTSRLVDPTLSFDRNVTLTPDNRWMLFTNGESYVVNKGSHIYLTYNPAVDEPQYLDPDFAGQVGPSRFLILAADETNEPLENAARPRVSPDGSRLVYRDPRFDAEHPWKMLKLKKLPHGFRSFDNNALIKYWTYVDNLPIPGKAVDYAWSPCGTHLIYIDPDEPKVVKIVSANLGEYEGGATPPPARTFITIDTASSVTNLEWAWPEK